MKRGVSAVTVILIVLGVVGVLFVGTCVLFAPAIIEEANRIQAERYTDNSKTRSADGSVLGRNERFTMVVPKSWRHLREEFAPDASLAIGDLAKGTCLTVVVESHDAFEPDLTLGQYADLGLDSLREAYPSFEVIVRPTRARVDGQPALRDEAKFSDTGTEFHFIRHTLRGRHGFYTISAWTLTSQMSAIREDFLNAIRSFREL